MRLCVCLFRSAWIFISTAVSGRPEERGTLLGYFALFQYSSVLMRFIAFSSLHIHESCWQFVGCVQCVNQSVLFCLQGKPCIVCTEASVQYTYTYCTVHILCSTHVVQYIYCAALMLYSTYTVQHTCCTVYIRHTHSTYHGMR